MWPVNHSHLFLPSNLGQSPNSFATHCSLAWSDANKLREYPLPAKHLWNFRGSSDCVFGEACMFWSSLTINRFTSLRSFCCLASNVISSSKHGKQPSNQQNPHPHPRHQPLLLIVQKRQQNLLRQSLPNHHLRNANTWKELTSTCWKARGPQLPRQSVERSSKMALVKIETFPNEVGPKWNVPVSVSSE